jgi:hypothetical protein
MDLGALSITFCRNKVTQNGVKINFFAVDATHHFQCVTLKQRTE